MSSLAIVLAACLTLSNSPEGSICRMSPDTIRVEYSDQADLTDNGVPEIVTVTAIGQTWNSLLIRLEIKSDKGVLLFADEWSSSAWCGGYGFYETRQGSVEEWVDERLKRTADPEWFLPTGSHGDRFGYGSVESLRSTVRMALYEPLWREKYKMPLHEHFRSQRNRSEIVEEFRDQISEDQVNAVLEGLEDGPCFVYKPHWDAIYGIAWFSAQQRFAIVLFIG